ncbi:patched domain-containing protein 3-like [Amia ocellicauda]|uniref:patched domain-containing protein 3-like n=1 Tax=Amia ocellicauda TaxID=2972642 RepID=UPI003463926D
MNMARCHTDCLEKPICRGFKAFGGVVGRKPWWFLVIPLLLSAGLGGGFYRLKETEANDIEDQFTPMNGPAKAERELVKSNFPQDDADFSSQRLVTEGTYASLILVSESDILTNKTFMQVQSLDKKVKNIIAVKDNVQIKYENICATVNKKCVSNAILDIVEINSGSVDQTPIHFPMHSFENTSIFVGTTLGGVNTTSQGVVTSAKAIRLLYYLRENSTSSTLWLQEFIEVFKNESTEMPYIKVAYFTSISRQEEFEQNSKTIIPLFAITYFLAISFSIVSCMRLDCVRNKVWVATVGVVSAGLSVLSSFGLLLYCGVPFAMTVANSPFLILGIGVDDMFIMISCWQQTQVHDPVEVRLADTYKEAAVSITITTLTDVLAFYIGIMTPFRSVQSFCLYTGTALLFCYFYSITFFGAFMALNGRREESNRHSLTCMKVPTVCPPGSSAGYIMCCVGGKYDTKTGFEEEQPMNYFFKNHYGPFLTKTWTKVFVILLYAGYLAASIYGCLQMKEGIDLKNLASDGSYVVNYYDYEDKYFSVYGQNVMVVVEKEVEYWNNSIRTELQSCMTHFRNLNFVDKEINISWLDSYESFANSSQVNLNNEAAFMGNLTTFLQLVPQFQQDLNMSNDKIYASRSFILTVNITSAVDEKNMLNELRDTAKNCPIPLLVYHPAFIYYDQYAVIVDNTIQNIGVATAVMLLISLLLIPNPLCSLWVTFAIGSVIVGVAGFMSLWDVNLDSISMINLVICIGFSVDFSAHISYAFVSSTKPNVNDKVVEALCNLGYAIVQGAVSTILGVVVLAAAKAYIFRTFFKIMFMVILFGAVHGLTFIPVFLTFFRVCSSKGEISNNKNSKSTSLSGAGGSYVNGADGPQMHIELNK